MVLIGLLVVALAFASALLYLRIQRANNSLDLEVRSVSLQATARGNLCMLYASLITNGEQGTLTYRWSTGTAAGPVMSVSIAAGQQQIVIGRQWLPDTSGAAEAISIQLLSPTPKSATTQPTIECQ